MATERQRRLYEAIEKQAYPSSETLAGRKEASDLGAKLDVEVFSYDSTPSRHNLLRDPVEQSKARRRRIYENAYNRPYPSKKRIHLFCGTENSVSSTTSLMTPSVVSPEISSSPSREFNQDWICNPAVSDTDFMSPDDETENNITPRKLWRAACGGIKMEVPEDPFCGAPLDEIMICTPPRGHVSPSKQGSGKKDRRSVSFSKVARSSSSGSQETIDTPNRPISKGESVANVFPLSTPNYLSNDFVPSAPVKVLASIIPKSLQRKPDVEERTGMQLPNEQRQHESYLALHQFLKNTDGDALKLYIDDYQVSIFDRIVESFYGNKSLKTLTISRSKEGSFGSERTIAEMVCLFEAIRCLPHLETLILWNARTDILPALVENLPRSLEKLCLQVVDGTVSNNILDIIAEKENLQNIQLETRGSMELGRLVNSSSIKSLRVCGLWYDMDEHHMQCFADSLYSNLDSPLKALDIQPTMNLSSWKYLATALRFNTRVRTLKMSFIGDSVAERDAAAVELAELLHANTALSHISNYTSDAVNVSAEIASGIVMEALQANAILHKFHFFQEESMFWVAKHALLKRNQEYFGEEGDLSHTIYQQYVNFASNLPSLQSKMCGEC
jgi:hypothetical protein